MRNEMSLDDLEVFTRNYSDYDVNFITRVRDAKKRYLNPNILKPPTSLNESILPYFEDDEKVAIVGDWGTGLKDAFDLLERLVVK